MGFMKIFSGKDPEYYEQKGDGLFKNGEYGAAKIEYETALDKVGKRAIDDDTEEKQRLEQKIAQAKNALACLHQKSGEELLKLENYEAAEGKFRLALELAEDPELHLTLQTRLEEMENLVAEEMEDDHHFDLLEEGTEDEPDYQDRLDDYFTALCSSLPDELMELYEGYGTTFKVGYVALNQGDFEQALSKLTQAMQENPSPDSFIPAELAKAHLNLKNYQEARRLLEDFLKKHTDSLHAYPLLCETYWELGEYELADQLLLSCPAELADSLTIQLLRGETLFQAKKYQEAESFYVRYLSSCGWDDHMAGALARTYEVLGEKEKAKNLYEEIIQECRGCGVHLDPLTKQRYANLCFEAGEHTAKLAELYLSLVRENPVNKADYYQKISQIFATQGNDREARRFQLFAERLNAN